MPEKESRRDSYRGLLRMVTSSQAKGAAMVEELSGEARLVNLLLVIELQISINPSPNDITLATEDEIILTRLSQR